MSTPKSTATSKDAASLTKKPAAAAKDSTSTPKPAGGSTSTPAPAKPVATSSKAEKPKKDKHEDDSKAATPAAAPAGVKPALKAPASAPASSSKLAKPAGPSDGSKSATPIAAPTAKKPVKLGERPSSAALKTGGSVAKPDGPSRPATPTLASAPRPASAKAAAPPPVAHGFKPNSSFAAPSGFQFSPAYPEKITSEKNLSPFDPRNLADEDEKPLKQLWLVRLPPGVTAADLAGTQIDWKKAEGTVGKVKSKAGKHDIVAIPEHGGDYERGEMVDLDLAVPSFDAGEDDGGGMVFAPVRFSKYLSLVPSAPTVDGIAPGAIPKPRARSHPPGMGKRMSLPIGASVEDDEDLDATLSREYSKGTVTRADPAKKKEKKKDKEKSKEKNKDKAVDGGVEAGMAPDPTALKGILHKRKDAPESEKKPKKKVRISDVGGEA